jgi:signal transduction histidine kinase
MLQHFAGQASHGSTKAGWRLFLGLAVLYFAADTLLDMVVGWEIFWPLNGITIALLIGRPRREWLLLLAGIELGTGAGDYFDGSTPALADSIHASVIGSEIVQRLLSMLEVTVSAWLLPPFTTLDTWLRGPSVYVRFVAAVIIGPCVAGLLAAPYFHQVSGQDYLSAFRIWALSDAMGIAVMLPLSLALRSRESRVLFKPPQLTRTLATLGTALVIMVAILGVSGYSLIFLLYPLLMLVDWMLGFSGSTIALCCACVLAVFLTQHGYGPFATIGGLEISRNFNVQLYLGFHLLGFLPISLLFLERRRMVAELREALAVSLERTRELRAAQSELLNAARQTGMAEIATNMLHNVGNALNSVVVSAGLIGTRIRESKGNGLANAVELMNQHSADLGAFMTRDERGKRLPEYLSKLAQILAAEKSAISGELESLTKGIDHIRDIVTTQQSYAGPTSLTEPVQVSELIEDSLRMNEGPFARRQVTILKHWPDVPEAMLDKHLMLQILINLIANALHAMDSVTDRPRRLTLRAQAVEGTSGRRLVVQVEDNGEGIPQENISRLFTHGFTTRKKGHGFGLHSCALAARAMDGELSARSDGRDKGAIFTLSLPLKESPKNAAVGL